MFVELTGVFSRTGICRKWSRHSPFWFSFFWISANIWLVGLMQPNGLSGLQLGSLHAPAFKTKQIHSHSQRGKDCREAGGAVWVGTVEICGSCELEFAHNWQRWLVCLAPLAKLPLAGRPARSCHCWLGRRRGGDTPQDLRGRQRSKSWRSGGCQTDAPVEFLPEVVVVRGEKEPLSLCRACHCDILWLIHAFRSQFSLFLVFTSKQLLVQQETAKAETSEPEAEPKDEPQAEPWDSQLLLALLRFYRQFLSPLLPPNCRYAPSCSRPARRVLSFAEAESLTWAKMGDISSSTAQGGGGSFRIGNL